MSNGSFSSFASTQAATRGASSFAQIRKEDGSSSSGQQRKRQHPIENVALAVLGVALGAYISARPCRWQ
jgi:hypothetical protein